MKRRLTSFITILVSSFQFLVTPAYAQGKVWTGRCVGSKGVLNGILVDASDVATVQGLECLFANILQVIVTLAGIAFFIMFLNGGFQYLFSSGDDKKAAAASSTLTMAIIGLVGVVGSWLILNLIKTITGANVTNFSIPGP